VRRPDDNPEKGKPRSRSDKKKGGWGAKRKMGKQHLRGTPVFFNLLRIHPSSLVSRLSTLFFFFRFYEIPFIFERDSRRSPYMLTRKKGRTRAQKWTRTPIAECAFRHLIRDRTAPINNPIRASGREKKKKERNRGRSG